MFIAVRNDLTTVQERGLALEGCEVITTSVQLVWRKKLFLSSFYWPPPDRDALDLSDDYPGKLYSKCPRFPNIILAGGGGGGTLIALVLTGQAVRLFWYPLSTHRIANSLLWQINLVSPSTLTRFDSFLDLVFSSNPGLIQACHVTPGLSDHGAFLFEIDTSPKFIPKPPRKIYLFHKADYTSLKSYLSYLSLGYLTNCQHRNVEENSADISSCISDAMDRFKSHKMSKGKRDLPWINLPVKRLMRKRDRAYKKAKLAGKEKDLKSY